MREKLLRETTVGVDLSKLIPADIFKSTRATASYESLIGTYDPYSFFLQSPKPIGSTFESRADDIFAKNRAVLSKCHTPQSKLSTAIIETTWHHEVRHFHDFVCTPAGYSFFLHEWRCLQLCSHELSNYGAQSGVLIEPFLEQTANTTSNPRIQATAQLFAKARIDRILFMGDFRILYVEPDTVDKYDVVWLNVGDGFPLVPTVTTLAIIDDRPVGRLIPLGFRALTEASATTYQMHWIRSIDEGIGKAYYKALRAKPEYVICNILATKLAKRIYGPDWSGKFDDGLVFDAVNLALSNPWLEGSSWPGTTFISCLENSFQDLIDGANDTVHEQLSRNYSDFLASLDEEDYSARGRSYVYLIREYAESICRQGLKCYLETPHFLTAQRNSESVVGSPAPHHLSSLLWYFINAGNMPSPLLFRSEGEVGFNSSFDAPRMLITLVAWTIYQDILESAAFKSELKCPVRHGQYSTLLQKVVRNSNFCLWTSEEMECGTCELGGPAASHISCGWMQMLTNFGFARKSN